MKLLSSTATYADPNTDSQRPRRYAISIPNFCKIVGYSPSTLKRRCAAGLGPRITQVSPRRQVIFSDDADTYMATLRIKGEE